MNEAPKAKPTFIITSNKALTVEAGGGIFGFGGVVIYEPHSSGASGFSLYPREDGCDRGTGFDYSDVARISLDEQNLWINNQLPEAPAGRQDVRETGTIKLELFDSPKLRQQFKRHKEAYAKLGLNSSD